jgi:hypothetical protein
MNAGLQPSNPFGVGVAARLSSGERGTVFPLFGDTHVHLGLVEPEALPAGGIGRVLDLGWSLASLQDWSRGSIPGLDVDYAGNFLAAEGGYPSDRSWAPTDATVFVDDAHVAVSAQVAAGVSAIKITLNADAGPVHSDETLSLLVQETHEAGLIPVIHAEGLGQAERAIRSSRVVLAHTPFSEVLSDDVISSAAQNNVGWMSTLDIHGYGDYNASFDIACENLRRFIAEGGNVFYGTDLGNGPLHVGINVRELRALKECGLTDSQLATSLSSWWQNNQPSTRLSFISDISDTNTEDVCTWLASARIVETTEVEYL